MELIFATLAMMTQGTAHNVAALLPKPPGQAIVAPGGAVPPYSEAYLRCLRRTGGAPACRRDLPPAP